MKTKSNASQKTYRTSDLYLGSYLCSLDFPFQGVEKIKEGKVVFLFLISDEELENSKTLFYSGKGEVSALKFVDNIRRLKGICHS